MDKVDTKVAENKIFEKFQEAFTKEYGVYLSEIIHRDKPDFEAFDPRTNQRIGIEVTGVYQDEREAKIQYGKIENWNSYSASLVEILFKLNNILAKKAEKSKKYNFGGQIFLAIWIGSLVFSQANDMNFIRRDIVIPENSFTKIWLILESRKDYSPELYLLDGM